MGGISIGLEYGRGRIEKKEREEKAQKLAIELLDRGVDPATVNNTVKKFMTGTFELPTERVEEQNILIPLPEGVQGPMQQKTVKTVQPIQMLQKRASVDDIVARQVLEGLLTPERAYEMKKSVAPEKPVDVLDREGNKVGEAKKGSIVIPPPPDTTKRDEAIEKSKEKMENRIEKAKNVLDVIDGALPKVNKWSAGLGSNLAGVGGTEAADLAADLATIEANLGIEALSEMKNESKVGASGLGALSEKELAVITSIRASLKQSQSPAQLKQRLNKLKTHFSNWLQMQEGINPFENKNVPRGTNQNASVKITVSNGKETYEIDQADLAEAQKDGFKAVTAK